MLRAFLIPARTPLPMPLWPNHLRRALLPCLLALLLNPFFDASAGSIWQCQQNGKTVYQDVPCGNGKLIPPAQTADRANLAEAKKRAATEKAQMAKIEARKAREEAANAKQAALAAKATQRRQAEQERRTAQCQRARLQQKWAEQDAASADARQLAKARSKALRAQEKTQLACAAR